jgi:hypothetical protein
MGLERPADPPSWKAAPDGSGSWLCRVVTACSSRLLWDAAFDAGKISSADDCKVLFLPSLRVTERRLILTNAVPRLAGLSPEHLINIERHRRRAGF